MKLDVLPIGLYEENIYILHENGHVLIFDPGGHAKVIMSSIDAKEKVDAIILTHGHEDHTAAVDDLVDEYQCPVYIHKDDMQLVDHTNAKSMRGYVAPIYSPLTELQEGEVTIGDFKLTVYHTPGHTAGSCCIQYKNKLFAGDTLFAGSIGRTDLYSGDERQMLASLRFLKTLAPYLVVYPGHGPQTTIADEIATNYYLRNI